MFKTVCSRNAWLVRLTLLLPLFLLSACPINPSTPATPPAAPIIVAAVTNAAVTPATGTAPAIVTIRSISWQKTNPHYAGTFTWGWLEDALVGNPYAFQLRINADLTGSSFEVLDANGASLASVTARSNTSHNCTGANGQAIPSSECYWSPGNVAYIAPPAVPSNAGVYTLGLVNTCADTITPSRTAYTTADRAAHCATGQAAGAAILLTISPRRPLPANTKVRYTLVAKNAAGAASTPLDVIYQPPPVYQPPVFTSGGTTSPGTSNMPPAPAACPGNSGGMAQDFSFQMTCTFGGTSSTTTYGSSACTRAQARQELLQIYAIEIAQGCVLGS